MRLNAFHHARQFEADQPEAAEAEESEEPAADAATDEPDYSFEGFSVDFIDKVALLPVARETAPMRKAG